MHLISLNIPDLLLALWRGTLDCNTAHGADNKSTWDWAVLVQGLVWKKHGQRVADATPYLPGSFDRPPRNPAEKISSGYKAWEFLTYIYSLGPGLFYGVLPTRYYQNYCKLVAAVRLLHQRSIIEAQLVAAHRLVVDFVKEFELIYYQRKESRLHFCRQSIHALLHLAPEIIRLGPPSTYTQWTMERTVGNLTEEINQPSNAFQNLAERGVRRAQENSLLAMSPDLSKSKSLPSVSVDLGDGYILLGALEEAPHYIPDIEQIAVNQFFGSNGVTVPLTQRVKLRKWARIQLPNMQIVRSYWKESKRTLRSLRMARNIMFYQGNNKSSPKFAEIRYFFRIELHGQERTVALVSRFSAPDANLLSETSGALMVCDYEGDSALEVVDVKDIATCIAMVPFTEPAGTRFFVCEKIGMEMAFFSDLYRAPE
ncbi:hypothetical protein BJ165DRAFT_1377881 [Panaeolus papilionaceus]|nr:hypothetical protein BJ165DRAFT_1377881 [Panaeolus papilionaceus]